MSNIVVVSLDEFYIEYPEFNNETYFNICPSAFRQAKNYFGVKNCGRLLDERRQLAIYLLTAHLAFTRNKIQTGTAGTGGMVASAAVGEVNVSYVQIPNLDQWSYWLAQSPYGLELLALLETLAVPFYVGGSLERVF